MSATVHRNRSACRAGAAAAGVVLFLAGCGGGDSRDGAAASPAATTAAKTAPSADADFCEQAADIDHRVDAAVSDLGPDSSLPDAVRQLTVELRAIEAPEAIAADWNALASGLDRLADAFADVDLADPSTFDAVEQAGAKLSAAGDRVDAYLRDQCGITP